MEVTLKKTKITANIIKQTLNATENDLKSFEVLGWCNYKVGKHTYKYILLYKSSTQELRTYLYFNDFESKYVNEYKDSPEKFYLVVRTPSYNNREYYYLTEAEREDFKEQLKKVKHQAEMRGQIYI